MKIFWKTQMVLSLLLGSVRMVMAVDVNISSIPGGVAVEGQGAPFQIQGTPPTVTPPSHPKARSEESTTTPGIGATPVIVTEGFQAHVPPPPPPPSISSYSGGSSPGISHP